MKPGNGRMERSILPIPGFMASPFELTSGSSVTHLREGYGGPADSPNLDPPIVPTLSTLSLLMPRLNLGNGEWFSAHLVRIFL
jgi:hypothetical protein